jgi:hypothetical protein
MKRVLDHSHRPIRPVIVLLLFALVSWSAHACTIVVLADDGRVLFCNNEDWMNPKTRIWFVPGVGRNGCAYVGYDDRAMQGGVNVHGLAFDFVAGSKEKWQKDPTRKDLGPAQSPSRMLETCATVDEAIAFYEAHNEPAFAGARIFIADRTGASAIIGVKNGRLEVAKTTECRAFGARGDIATRMLTNDRAPTLANATRILRASAQRNFFGAFGTQYSNVFDLKTGDIFIFQFPLGNDVVKLNLAEELIKGAHVIENRTPMAPYAFVVSLTCVPSIGFMAFATLAKKRRKIALALSLLAVFWVTGIGVLFFLLGRDGRANSLTIMPVTLAPLVVILCVGWFAGLRKAGHDVAARLNQEPNKAPEPTTMAVTSRAPSSTSRASHGRGSS